MSFLLSLSFEEEVSLYRVSIGHMYPKVNLMIFYITMKCFYEKETES
jgi:hypothetical protein